MRSRLIILSLVIGLSTSAAPPDSLVIHSSLAGNMTAGFYKNAEPGTAGYYVFRFRSWSAPDHDRARKAGPPILLDWPEMKMKTTDKGESRQIFDRASAWLSRIDMHAGKSRRHHFFDLRHARRGREQDQRTLRIFCSAMAAMTPTCLQHLYNR